MLVIDANYSYYYLGVEEKIILLKISKEKTFGAKKDRIYK